MTASDESALWAPCCKGRIVYLVTCSISKQVYPAEELICVVGHPIWCVCARCLLLVDFIEVLCEVTDHQSHTYPYDQAQERLLYKKFELLNGTNNTKDVKVAF